MGFTCYVIFSFFFLKQLFCLLAQRSFSMEFDLNTEIAEVEEEENDDGGAGIEKGRLGISPSSSSSCSSGSSSSSTASASSIYSELWHACAGSLTSLPKKGNVVVYFPKASWSDMLWFHIHLLLISPNLILIPKSSARWLMSSC